MADEMSEMVIRTAEPHEFEAARSVLRSGYAQYEASFPEENWVPYLADILDLEGRAEASELLIAERDGIVVGCVSYFPPGSKASYPSDSFSEHWPSDWAAFRLLSVDPAARGGGVGKALTVACIERAREQGAPTLGLHTTAPMRIAREMYERMGFIRAPRFDFHPSPEIAVEAYQLELEAHDRWEKIDREVVFTTGRRMDAEMVRGLLETSGLDARIWGGGMGAYRLESALTEVTGVPNAFNSYRVGVPVDEAEEAKAILADVEDRSAHDLDDEGSSRGDGFLSSMGTKAAVFAAALFLLWFVITIGPDTP